MNDEEGMTLHFKAKEPIEGYQVIASPENSPLKWLTFGTLNLFSKTNIYEGKLADEEAVLTLLSGTGTIEIRENSGQTIHYSLGPRTDPFTERATMIYLPPQSTFQVTGLSPVFKSTLHKVPAEKQGHPLLIQPKDVTPVPTGRDNWQRDICLCTAMDLPIQRLSMGETISQPGNWSSYPPHKHDEEKLPMEFALEEIYYFLLNPKQGFGMMRVYDPPEWKDRLDETFVLQDGDTVVIPHGYHPVVVAPGYQIYYLFSLAGRERHHGTWSDDPDHQWVKNKLK